MVSRGSDNALDFASCPHSRHTRPVKRVASLALAVAFLVSACTTDSGSDPSATPGKPKDFCHAMQAAAKAAPAAAEALDTLFTTIEGMAQGASEGDIDNLHTAGASSEEASTAYIATLDAAQQLAEGSVADDLGTLSDYWTLYAVGMAQIAVNVNSYGKLIDQTQALATAETTSAVVAEQPAAQKRINDAYLAQCAG